MALPVNKISTADIVCAVRGWHSGDTSPVFKDPYAHLLCGPILGPLARFRPLGGLAIRIFLQALVRASMAVFMRARHAEEALEEAVKAGIQQYVIIGAGMDSFAFRRTDLVEQVDSYEIDHPVTQAKKLERIGRAGLEVPPSHHFVAADLAEVSPVEALADSPFNMGQPAFMSLLGVAYYLTQETLVENVRSLSEGLPAGTRLILDYMLDIPSCDSEDLELRSKVLGFVKGRGEPMKSGYSLRGLEALMADEGFRTVENFPLKVLEERYLREGVKLPYSTPGIFGLGTFEITERSA